MADLSDKTASNSLLRQKNHENETLRKKLELLETNNEQLHELNEKLSRKLMKIKKNMDSLHRSSIKSISGNHRKSTDKLDGVTVINTITDDDLNELQKQRDYYQKEYLQLLNRPTYEADLEQLRARLATKEMDLANLQQKCDEQARALAHSQSSERNNYSVQSSMLRLQRERDVAQSDRERLHRERDELQRQLDATLEMRTAVSSMGEQQQREQRDRIGRLESENRSLMMAAGSHAATVDALRNELSEVRAQLRSCQSENAQLQTASNQLK